MYVFTLNPYRSKYVTNILTAVILKDKLFAMNFLVLCITVPDTYCAHVDKTKSLETYVLKVIPLGTVFQECLVL